MIQERYGAELHMPARLAVFLFCVFDFYDDFLLPG
jgi:hypothetical protein